MPSVILTQPTVEPVTLAEAKQHLRVDVADDDDLISVLIAGARQSAEGICRRALCTQTVKLVLDQFPAPNVNIGSANWYGPQWGTSPGPLTVLQPSGKTGFEIILPLTPLMTVTSIKYIDQDGVQQTLAASAYKVDSVTEPARILPAYGTTWPQTRNEINAVEVVYQAGYGAAADVPAGIKAWMKLRIGAMYDNREEVAVIRGSVLEMPFADRLLDPYRVVTF